MTSDNVHTRDTVVDGAVGGVDQEDASDDGDAALRGALGSGEGETTAPTRALVVTDSEHRSP